MGASPGLPARRLDLGRSLPAIIAIPARNEAARIQACLAALAMQRDRYGAPLVEGAFEILVFANNCSDDTERHARDLGAVCPHTLTVVSETLPLDRANAGWARKRAMDLAAARLRSAGLQEGLLLTTDADSCASPTWFAETYRAMADGNDCVAGYIDALPAELMRLGPAFVRRSRLEDRYLRLVAEVYAICDPRPHDPWPNHRVSSGASLAVTLTAFEAVGGMPPEPLGEDRAFTHALEAKGFLVRRPMSVAVYTSCRLQGRATGGAADTMRLRHEDADAPCDGEVEPISVVLRRARWRGALRKAKDDGQWHTPSWAKRLGLRFSDWSALVEQAQAWPFEACWDRICAASPTLRQRWPLSPNGLPEQIACAEALLSGLRRSPTGSVDPLPQTRSSFDDDERCSPPA